MNPVVTFNVTDQLGSIQGFIHERKADAPNVLVVLDMDLTLTMPPVPVMAYLTLPTYRTKLQQILSSYSEKEQRAIMTVGLQVSQQTLVEPGAPALINALQAAGIKMVVLTASLTGQLNDSTPIELQRFEKLKSLGIVIDQPSSTPEITFTDPAQAPATPYARYYHGILCVSGQPGTNAKGPGLLAWLAHIPFMPHTVIMVDDKKQHLADVYQSLSTLQPSIEFIGLEYQGATKYVSHYEDEAAFTAYWKTLASQVLQRSMPPYV